MRKISSLMLLTLMVALLVGCGGGSSSSSSSTTNVAVTKGSLIDANAVDQNGNSGKQVMNGDKYTNEYKFEGEITYPIVVIGGYVDINSNGVKDSEDYKFNGTLKSYSNVVTPITTYLGDPKVTGYKDKLNKLKELTKASDDELLNIDPSETNEDIISLNAAIYEIYKTQMEADSEIEYEADDTTISDKLEAYKETISQGTFEAETLEEKFQRVEEELKQKTGAEELGELGVKNINFSKDDLVGKKLDDGGLIYYFRDNDIILVDNYYKYLTYKKLDNGIKLIQEVGVYYILKIIENGYVLESYVNSEFVYSHELAKSSLVEFDESEITQTKFVLTKEMISNKKIITKDEDGISESIFYSNGNYFESWDDTGIGGEAGSCSGTWILDKNNANSVYVNLNCTDVDFGVYFNILFDDVPQAGATYIIRSKDFDIEYSGTVNSVNSLFVLSRSMISNKEIISSNNKNRITTQFKEDGTFISSTKNLLTSENHDLKCQGNWVLDTSVLNKINLESTCSDFTTSKYSISFNEEPQTGKNLELINDNSYEIYEIENLDNVSIPLSSLLILNENMISGKNIYTKETNGHFKMDFNENKSYISSIYKYTDYDRLATCEGTWNLSTTDSRIINIQSECSDSVTENFHLFFDEIPNDSVKFEIVNKNQSDIKMILMFRDITTPITPIFSFSPEMIKGKEIHVNNFDESRIMKFGNKYYYEIIENYLTNEISYCSGSWSNYASIYESYSPDNTITISYQCSGNEEFTYFGQNKEKYLVFKKKLEEGAIIDDYTSGFSNDLTVVDFSSMNNHLSNKTLTLYDNTNDEIVILTVSSNGLYKEVGNNYSYEGSWLSLNDLKIVIDINKISGDSNKKPFRVELDLFSNDLAVGDEVKITYYDTEYSYTIQDITAF